MKREDFIRATRKALGKTHSNGLTEAASLPGGVAGLRNRAKAALERIDQEQDQILDRLCQTAMARGWHVTRAHDTEQAIDHVVRVAGDADASLVVRSAQDVFDGLPVDEALTRRGVTTTVMGGGLSGPREDMRQAAASAHLGITGVDYAIAETGSVVLLPSQRLSRLTSLLPPVHLAIVRPKQVLDSLDDLFLLMRSAFYEEGKMAPYLNFVTGPSRTADIEQQIVIGVHGPREVHMLIWEDAATTA